MYVTVCVCVCVYGYMERKRLHLLNMTLVPSAGFMGLMRGGGGRLACSSLTYPDSHTNESLDTRD